MEVTQFKSISVTIDRIVRKDCCLWQRELVSTASIKKRQQNLPSRIGRQLVIERVPSFGHRQAAGIGTGHNVSAVNMAVALIFRAPWVIITTEAMVP